MNCYVIDIGTNSCRLMRAALTKSGVCCIYKKVITARTGQGVNYTKALSQKAILRTVSAVSELFNFASNEDPSAKIYCFATSATRDALNAGILLNSIKQKTGLIVDVISGEIEAKIGFLGAVGIREGGLLDIGGGSTEIAFGKDGKREFFKSFDIGAVRALDMFSKDIKQTYDYSVNLFSSVPNFSGNFYACGGTCTTLAAMMQKLDIYDPKMTDGFILERDGVKELLRIIAPMPIEKRKSLAGLQPERADIIIHGISILLAFYDSLNTVTVTVSEADNMEGYITYLIKNGLIQV